MATKKKTTAEPKAPETDKIPEAPKPVSEPVSVPAGYVALTAPLDLAAHFPGERCQYQGKEIKDGDQVLPIALAIAWQVDFVES